MGKKSKKKKIDDGHSQVHARVMSLLVRLKAVDRTPEEEALYQMAIAYSQIYEMRVMENDIAQ